MTATNRDGKILHNLSATIQFDQEQEWAVHDALENTIGADRPKHLAFTKMLQSAPRHKKPKYKNGPNPDAVILADLQVIIQAWDDYANLPENRADLKTVAQYVEAMGRFKVPSRNAFLAQKRKTILRLRGDLLEDEDDEMNDGGEER